MPDNWTPVLYETCISGINSSVTPELLPANQLAWMMNGQVREGKPVTRPPLTLQLVLPSGLVQGADFFSIQDGMLVLQIAGNLWRIRVGNQSFASEQINLGFPNSALIPQAYMCETDQSFLIQDGQSDAIIYDGSSTRRSDVQNNEVPRGTLMAYGDGRLAVATGINTLTIGNIKKDAYQSELQFTETLAAQGLGQGGGSFYFSQGMTALGFLPITGTADMGSLMVFSRNGAKAIRLDITDRSSWAQIPGFVSTVLRDTGAISQWSLAQVNQDMYWRDGYGDIRSISSSVNTELSGGNTPLSREMARITDYETVRLLDHSSAIYFDNRFLCTASPFLDLNHGVSFLDLISLDFAALANLQGESPPAYDGSWTGLQFVKLVKGVFGGNERAFVISSDPDGQNRLWEINPSSTAEIADRTTACDTTPAYSPISCYADYARTNFGLPQKRKRLERCDVYLADIDGQVDLTVSWRPDASAQWYQWDTATVCATTTDPSTATPHVFELLTRQQRPQVKTFTMPDNLDTTIGFSASVGFYFQVRIAWVGHARIDRVVLYGNPNMEDTPLAERDVVSAVCVAQNIA